MIYLLLSILASTGIVVMFKLIDGKVGHVLPAIFLNYIVALFVGLSLYQGNFHLSYILQAKWIYLALIIGSLLLAGFYLMASSTKKAGLAITSLANKMSVVIPIGFSILYYHENVGWMKIIGILLAIVALLLSVYRKSSHKFSYWPLVMFLVVGIIDAAIKLAQQDFIPLSDRALFPAVSFGIAAVVGLILILMKPRLISEFKSPASWWGGIGLGIFNYGSMYFLIQTLGESGIDSSIVYGLNNLGIILLSVLIAFSFFKEKLSKLNYWGIAVAVLAIIILNNV